MDRRRFVQTQQDMKKYSLDSIHDMMCFLMTKRGILCGKLLFRCELSHFWDFIKTDEDPHHPHCVVMKIFQGKRILTG